MTPACAVTPTLTPGPTVSWLTQVKPLFVQKGCLDCHSNLFPASSYNLFDYAGATGRGDLARSLNGCDVVKGSADQSLLIQKLEKTPGFPGQPMPPGASPTMDPTSVARIRLWIDQGGQNN